MALAAVGILVPVLGRPHRVFQLVESVRTATTPPWHLVFVATVSDGAEVEAIEPHVGTKDDMAVSLVKCHGPRQRGDWARKINAAYHVTAEPYFLLGADDIRFHPGWHEEVDAAVRAGWGVIGTNDMASPRVVAGRHSTHPVVTRWYADGYGTVDGPGQVAAEVYDHNYVDDEIVETARSRRMWAHAAAAKVEHLHPSWGTAPSDATYLLGREHFHHDRATYLARAPMWAQQ